MNKLQVYSLIKLASAGENYTEESQCLLRQEPSLVKKMLEAKILVDRWNIVVTDFIFNSSKKLYVEEQLASKFLYGTDRIWGAKINYLDIMPDNCGLALSLSDNGKFMEERHSKSLAIFPM
jgi:hypothetical protein